MTEPNNLSITPGVIESKNPLEVIGWTYEVLQLRLTDEQYHEKAKKEARFLLTIHHEDKGGSKETSQHYSQAYENIQNEELFKKALRDFRVERNERARSESELVLSLKSKVGILERQVKELNKESKTGQNGVVKLSEINTNLTKFLASNAVDVSLSSADGYTQTSSLHLVNSIELVTVRISGLDKVFTVTKPGDIVYTGQQIRSDAHLPIIPQSVLGYQYGIRWASFRTFLINHTHPSRHLIIRHEKFKVENGALVADYKELNGARILGTIAPSKIVSTRTTRLVLTEVGDVVANISPYMSTLSMMLVDRKPKVIRNDSFTLGSQHNFVVKNLESKVQSYVNNVYKKSASTHMAVLGMIVGINT